MFINDCDKKEKNYTKNGFIVCFIFSSTSLNPVAEDLHLTVIQGSHRLEKYLNIQDCLEMSLKIEFALKVLENHSKALKSPWILLFSVQLSTVDRDLNQHKIVVPLFGAAYAAPNKSTTILY